ncbi:ATP-binding cassette domain-containing protein [Alicycliphilus denitrificans]|uniref:ABC transporter ATP-binding protein n=1 Tax=Alicycliphilus denitrificans TaxID=179636 RepID=A0A3R7EBP2_9BURK|nr:dipeptide/oligopeptide/nickel ABC transporter ATP-binding protein [Alicycliphilus denitrificans]RKJ94115.1 ABC transporter ATP-binding protein [Alicycliphilus denitrificans]
MNTIEKIASGASSTGAAGRFDDETPLLRVRDLRRDYPLPRTRFMGPRAQLAALQGVSFDVAAGRSLGVVGESGSGKSTLARLVMALDTPSAGTVELLGRDLHRLSAPALRAARRDFQMVFQDPYGSLDPRQTVERIVTEPLQALERATRAELRERAAEALAQVGLRAGDAHKYPHEFSRGQRQRIAIARALLVDAPILVLDEATASLDARSEEAIGTTIGLLKRRGRTVVLIAHRPSTMRHADRVVSLQDCSGG